VATIRALPTRGTIFAKRSYKYSKAYTSPTFMKARLTLIVIILLLLGVMMAYSRPDKERRYYQIKVKDKIGFINSSGKVIIEPQFAAAGNFVNGLAPARKDGYYGYIDTTGTFVIPPTYDYANDFDHGLAKVYTAGYNISYIQPSGEEVFPGIIRADYDTNGIWVCFTKSGHYGVFTSDGRNVIDTIYSYIKGKRNGYFIVQKPIVRGNTTEQKKNYPFTDLYAIVDDKGNTILDFQTAHGLESAENGFAILEDTNSIRSIINYKGEKLLSYFEEDYFVLPYFTDSIVVLKARNGASLRFHQLDTILEEYTSVLFNPFTQKAVIMPPAPYEIRFNKGYATYRAHDDSIVAINIHGQRVTVFSETSDVPIFKNEKAIIKIKSNGRKRKEGIISRNGQYIEPPIYYDLTETPNPNYYIYEMFDTTIRKSLGMGFIDIKHDSVSAPIFNRLHTADATYDFVPTYIGQKLTFINYSGEVIWQDRNDRTKGSESINIDFRTNNSYEPRQIYIPNTGNPKSRGDRKEEFSIADSLPTLSIHKLVLKVDCSDTTRDRYTKDLCYTMTLFNGSDTLEYIPRNCGSDHFIMQAKDRKGVWCDIETNHCSGCVVSRGHSGVAPKYFRKYYIPIYEGGFKTKLRIKGDFKSGDVYSNEFDGSVNPGQFWRPENLDKHGDW
jgi:hypothetical protein